MKELMYFVCGAAVGAAVALLMAPEKGEVIRAKIRKAVDDDIELGKEVAAIMQEAVADTTSEVKRTISKRK